LVITTQPKAPVGSGGPLTNQPVVKVDDQYGNVVTNSSASIAAAAVQGTWTLGGTTTMTPALGAATFTNLTAFSINAVSGATISFTASGLAGATSSPGFAIPAAIPSSLAGVKLLSAGQLKFSFTNATGLSFSVLATNNLSAPKTNWPVVGQAVESPAGSGNYQFTNSPATNGWFYLLRQP
jgi:hypothetical protein